MVRQLGAGVLNDATVRSTVADDRARVTVSGEASKLLPFLPVPRISETVEGPVERFVPDDGANP